MLLKLWLEMVFFIDGNLTLKIILFYIVDVEIVSGIWFCVGMW